MNALAAKLNYNPDHAAPPGQLIQEYLETLDISARELARRCGRSGKLVAEIVSGKAPVEPETALKKANRKFRARFKFIEQQLKAAGRTLDDASLDEMDELWNRSKSASTAR